MSSNNKEALIGAFVLMGIALFIGVIITLGAGRFFSETTHVISYFDGSINGLRVGSPVKFRGAKVGEITNVGVELDRRKKTITIPITYKIESFHIKEVGELDKKRNGKYVLKRFIALGLRAQLRPQSLVTGQLYIELDFHPESPGLFAAHPTDYIQIPSIPSTSSEFDAILTAAKGSLESAQKLLGSPKLNIALDKFTALAGSTKKLIDNTNKHVTPLASKFNKTIDELSDTLRSVRILTEYLTRHPEALLRGKRTRRPPSATSK